MAASGAGGSFNFLVTNLALMLLVFGFAATSDGCRFGSDSDCIFPCHCQSNDPCDRTTGSCNNGCQQDTRQGGPFSGPGCQIGNVAFQKNASQVGTWGGMVAFRAVQGDVNQINDEHCAHPDASSGTAWWKVDLGTVYVISNVTIYAAESESYLHDFTIYISKSSDTIGTNCVSYRQEIARRSNKTLTCTSQQPLEGQYIKIQKMTGTDDNVMRVCEVLVTGYKYKKCSDACQGICDHVVGTCDKCRAGKKQPDCEYDCDNGNYGVNCAETCGQCAGSETCDKVTGACREGCQQWYVTIDTNGPNTCKDHIVNVDYSPAPQLVSKTSSSVTVKWTKSDQVTAGLESYYQYVVEATTGDPYLIREVISYENGQNDATATVTGLIHNTDYEIRVKICARLNSQFLNGSTGGLLTVKTECTVPEKPTIKSVIAKLPVGSGRGSLQVTWQALGNSGCDRVKTLLVQYKLGSQGQWQDKAVTPSTLTQITIDDLDAGSYTVRLSVTNNKDMTVFSEISQSTSVLNTVDYSPAPQLVSKTSSSVTVKWTKADQVTAGLESYYQYVVEATTSGQDPVEVVKLLGSDLRAVIAGLKHNKEYEIRVRVTDKTKTLTGAAGGILNVTTKCAAPDRPEITNVTTVPGSLHVTWKTLGDSGCDSVKTLLVQYKLGSQGQWQDKPVTPSTLTQMTIDNLEAGSYTVRLTVTNNDGINVFSDTSLPPKVLERTIPPSNEPVITDGGSGGSNSSGVIVAVIVSLVVLIVLVLVAVLLFIRLRHRVVWNRLADKTFPGTRTSPEGEDNEAFNLAAAKDDDDDCELAPVPVEVVSSMAGPPVAPRPEVKQEEAIYNNVDQGETRVKVEALETYIQDKMAEKDGFGAEFNRLPATEMARMQVSKHPDNRPKNRFRNIWAYDSTRVILDADEENPSDYINANYITGYKNRERAYVACQGPKDTTVADMWRMIWQLKSSRIAMTTQLVDSSKNKCYLYWPEDVGAQAVYDEFTVTSVAKEVYADYTVRTLTVTYKGESRTVTHFQYTTWLDKGVPKYSYPLLAYRRLVRSFDDHSTGPIIVHCSAGIGRTGTFIALDSLLDMGQAEGEVDVFQFVSLTRMERMHMIQTQGQYEFLYRALADGLKTFHLAYPVAEFPEVYRRLCMDDSNLTEINEQFQLLESMKPDPPLPTCDALREDNKAKNQSLDIIPDNYHRPYLSTQSEGRNDYINAVYVDSFRRENGHLLTQMPLPDTVVDFWRLVYDQRCPAIIMLEELGSQEDAPYWPEDDNPVQTHGTLTVELLKEKPSGIPNVTECELSVHVTADPKRVHKVKQYQLMSGWPKTDRLPSSTDTLLRLMELVNRPLSEDEYTGPVILQCRDGASRSGLFCVASHLLGSLTVDQYVDVFHSAQHVRNKRPQAIDTVEQYQFLYKLVVDFQQQNDPTYVNLPPKNV